MRNHQRGQSWSGCTNGHHWARKFGRTSDREVVRKASRRRLLRLIHSSKEWFALPARFCVTLCTSPARQHEGDFVDEVGNVVGHVECLGCPSRFVDLAKEVTCRMRLNSIICRGTVMLQSMYLYTIGLLPTETQY